MQLLIVFALSILFTGSIFSQELMVEEIVLQNSTKLIITEENSGKKDSIEIFGWQSYFITNNTLFVVNDGVEIFGSLRYEVSIKEKRLFSIMEYEKQVSIIIYGKCGSFEYAKNDEDIFLPSSISTHIGTEFIEFTYSFDSIRNKIFFPRASFNLKKFTTTIKNEFKKNKILRKCANLKIVN